MQLDYKSKVAIVYLLGFAIDLVNMYIANVAFPNIGHELHVDINQLTWVANSYTLGLTLIIPASGFLGSKFGTKPIFIGALILFLLTVTFCALATSIYQLIFWRFLQGLSGGLIIPIGQTMTYRLYPAHQRAKLSAIILAVTCIAIAISPTLGGLLVEFLSWRWVFIINIPLGVVIIYFAVVWLKLEEATSIPPKFDILGMLLISSALLFIFYGLYCFKTTADVPYVLTYLGLGLLILGIFVVRSLKMPIPLLELRILRNRLFVTGIFYYQFISGIFTGVSILNIFLYQMIFGISPLKTGLLMLPFALGCFIAINGFAKLFNKYGPKPIAFIGIGTWIIGLLIQLNIYSSVGYKLGMVAYLVMGLGSGTMTFTAQSMAMLEIGKPCMGSASALWNLNRQLSFSIGAVIFAMLFEFIRRHYNLVQSLGAFNTTYLQAMINVFHVMYIIAIAFTLPAIIATIFLNNRQIVTNIRNSLAA